MSSWSEGALAVIILLGLGIGLFLFTGQTFGDGTTDSTIGPIVIDPAAAERGEVLAEGQGCLQCHTTDGRPGSGPTWKGVAGSLRPLTDGDEVLADDTYLFNSIIDPDNQVVDGYDAIMPKFYVDQLDDGQITDLVEYIKSLAA